MLSFHTSPHSEVEPNCAGFATPMHQKVALLVAHGESLPPQGCEGLSHRLNGGYARRNGRHFTLQARAANSAASACSEVMSRERTALCAHSKLDMDSSGVVVGGIVFFLPREVFTKACEERNHFRKGSA